MTKSAIVSALLLLAVATGCADSAATAPAADTTSVPNSDSARLARCAQDGLYLDASLVPSCAFRARVIGARQFRTADSLVRNLIRLRDSLKTGDTATFYRATELTRALGHLSHFHGRGLLRDSARFNRVMDILGVTEDLVRGRLRPTQPGGARYMPARTPGLVWVYYNSNGIFFQPVTTIQTSFLELPEPWNSTDSLVALGEAMDRYAVFHEVNGRRFPVWEYLFSFQTAAGFLSPPWQSAMSQGKMLALYSELFARTGERVWRDRAREAFNAFRTPWHQGGVLVPDSTHGYWWDEYSPVDRVFNGSVVALLGLGRYVQATGDPEAERMYKRGAEAVKYWAPYFDSGSWSYYSFSQGLNSRAYHALHVKLMRMLAVQSGDPWFAAMADRWAAYTPPPGVN